MLMYLSLSTLVQIVKVLGEGGFSFVYLAQDEHSGVRFHCTVFNYLCSFYLSLGRGNSRSRRYGARLVRKG